MRSDGDNGKQWVPRRRLNHSSHFGEGLGVSSKEEIRIAASVVPSQAFALQKCVHLCPRKHECEGACSHRAVWKPSLKTAKGPQMGEWRNIPWHTVENRTAVARASYSCNTDESGRRSVKKGARHT